MIKKEFAGKLSKALAEIDEQGLRKRERLIDTAQSPDITVGSSSVLNFCANNYLGLANDPTLIEAACTTLKEYGYGMASVRFICGTQTIHCQLEEAISNFLRKEASILYTSCFDANGGLFEPLLGESDAIISDSLNHASIVDGVRLCKAMRFLYQNRDMDSLRDSLKQARSKGAENILIATDSVFSMDGEIAPLEEIVQLAKENEAILMIDESHATGFMGARGEGAAEELGVLDQVDIITSTFGKALGGAVGGFTSSSSLVVDMLRQKSRPYLFSNSLPPAVVGATLQSLRLISESNERRAVLRENTKLFREEMRNLGFTLKGDRHPIVPIMLGDAKLAVEMSNMLLKEGIYVIGFSYPVVPKGQARIRVQLSAAHSTEQVQRAVEAFAKAGRDLGVIA